MHTNCIKTRKGIQHLQIWWLWSLEERLRKKFEDDQNLPALLPVAKVWVHLDEPSIAVTVTCSNWSKIEGLLF